MYTLSLMLMFYVKLFMKYGKANFLFSMAAILNIAKNGGSIKISGCFHQNSEIVWHGGHLCQISCFCPEVRIYYIKSHIHNGHFNIIRSHDNLVSSTKLLSTLDAD